MSRQPPDDSGVTDLLRRASDDLVPDVDRLVSGGISRGRSRQRRTRIGTTVASLAVIGVVGVLAVVVPHVGGADSARDPGIATDGASVTEVPSPTRTPQAEGASQLADFAAAEMPAMVVDLIGTKWGDVPEPTISVSDQVDVRRVEFAYDGMSTTVGIERSDALGPRPCAEEADRLGGTCEEVSTGEPLIRWGPTLADGVTCQGVSLWRGGWEVYATSCNAAVAKDSTPLSPQPPISSQQLVVIATSDAWFAP